MAYDTKVLLLAIGEIIKKSSNIEEVYNAIAKIANAEGVIFDPYHDENRGSTMKEDN